VYKIQLSHHISIFNHFIIFYLFYLIYLTVQYTIPEVLSNMVIYYFYLIILFFWNNIVIIHNTVKSGLSPSIFLVVYLTSA